MGFAQEEHLQLKKEGSWLQPEGIKLDQTPPGVWTGEKVMRKIAIPNNHPPFSSIFGIDRWTLGWGSRSQRWCSNFSHGVLSQSDHQDQWLRSSSCSHIWPWHNHWIMMNNIWYYVTHFDFVFRTSRLPAFQPRLCIRSRFAKHQHSQWTVDGWALRRCGRGEGSQRWGSPPPPRLRASETTPAGWI